MKLRKKATEAYDMLLEASDDTRTSRARVTEWHRRFSIEEIVEDDQRSSRSSIEHQSLMTTLERCERWFNETVDSVFELSLSLLL